MKYIFTAVVALVVSLSVGFSMQSPEQSNENIAGLSERNIQAITLATSGRISQSNTGTSSLVMKSLSSTKGWCTEFNATSSLTVLNMTFAASSTAASTVGVAPIIRYGACN